MQLELGLQTPPEAAQLPWEQIPPAQQEALTQRLALLIAKATIATPRAQEHANE